MRQLAEKVFAAVAGVAIAILGGLLTFVGILSGEGGADATTAALIIGPVDMAEVTFGQSRGSCC